MKKVDYKNFLKSPHLPPPRGVTILSHLLCIPLAVSPSNSTNLTEEFLSLPEMYHKFV